MLLFYFPSLCFIQMNGSFASLLAIGLLTLGASACQAGNDPAPKSIADSDVLMMAHGYWEWESSVAMSSHLSQRDDHGHCTLLFIPRTSHHWPE